MLQSHNLLLFSQEGPDFLLSHMLSVFIFSARDPGAASQTGLGAIQSAPARLFGSCLCLGWEQGVYSWGCWTEGLTTTEIHDPAVLETQKSGCWPARFLLG